jgi:subtilisin family serine protease
MRSFNVLCHDLRRLGVLTVAIWIVFAGGSALGGTPEQRVIIGFERPPGLSAQSVVQALESKLFAQSADSKIEHVYELIDAVVARVDPQTLDAIAQDLNVRYVVPDGLVATPEHRSGESSRRPADLPELMGQATPVELYTWGIERIHAPEVHRAKPSRGGLSATPLAVGGLVVVGLLGLALPGRAARRLGLRRSLLAVAALGLMSALPGCTVAVVLPHPGILGEGIGVALLDTGVDLTHPDLRSNIAGGIDFVNRDDEPQDDNGHGTGVAGLLAAAENARGLVGTAPRVEIWSVKMLRFDEQGSISDLIRGIEWAMQRGVRIISMSLGTEEDNPALHEAIQVAYQAGVLLVAAAGNKGQRVLFPAAYPEVIAVAATDRDDQRAWFSNMGPEVELSAPGTELLTTGLKGDYQIVNGTSFAVPQVAGVAALLFSAGVGDAREVRRRLDQTAEDLGLSIIAQGYGLVDAERAILGGGGTN